VQTGDNQRGDSSSYQRRDDSGQRHDHCDSQTLGVGDNRRGIQVLDQNNRLIDQSNENDQDPVLNTDNTELSGMRLLLRQSSLTRI
jgi:hypothetical protein